MDISQFAAMATLTEGDVTVYKDKYVINAKSIMGLFSLNLGTGATVEYPENAVKLEEFLMGFKAD